MIVSTPSWSAQLSVLLLISMLLVSRPGIGSSVEEPSEEEFKPTRISRSATIILEAPLQEVLPLFGPIEEKKWAEGWEPEIVFTATGSVEEHMVFRTRSGHESPHEESTWVVSKYSPEQAVIEYTVFAAERLWWITIRCANHAPGEQTHATISYSYLGLTEQGQAINRKALRRMFAHDLKDWEVAINHYLRTGECLRAHPHHPGDRSPGSPSAADGEAGAGSRGSQWKRPQHGAA